LKACATFYLEEARWLNEAWELQMLWGNHCDNCFVVIPFEGEY